MSNSFANRVARTVLPNGITLLVLENHANPTVSITGYLYGGEYFNPTQRSGLAELTASMMNKGTRRRGKLEIAEALEFAGAHVGFSANTFSVSADASSLTRDFAFVMETIAEELREPLFPADELDKLKQRTVAAIQRSQENTRGRAMERLSQLLYPRSSVFHELSAEESITHIEAITTADIRRFYLEHYGAESLILSIAGDVNAAEVEALVTRTLGDWQGAPVPRIHVDPTPLPAGTARETVLMKDKANVDVVIGHPSQLRRANPDYLPAVVANRALGQSTISSRLGLKVRDEMGLTYGINSYFADSGLADGPYVIGLTLAPEDIDLGINTTLEIVDEFVREGIREEELADEKSSIIGSFKVGLATNSGMSHQLASAEFYDLGMRYLDEFPETIRAITKSQVDDAIRKYIHPEIAATVIAGTL
ncbi:MAG: M16 family metallopeptidase [Blastocatellia bacterium]